MAVAYDDAIVVGWRQPEQLALSCYLYIMHPKKSNRVVTKDASYYIL